jgi:hypothetical protein
VPSYDQLEVIKPNGEIEFYKLDASKGIANIGSDLGNEVVLDAPGIKPFYAFLDYRQLPARLTILEREAGLLSVKPPQILPNFGTVELDGYILIFLEGDHDGAAELTPALGSASAPDILKPSSLMTIPFPNQADDEIVAQLSTRALTVEIEEAALLQVSITNSGPSRANFAAEVVGLDPNWVTLSESQVELGPGERQMILLTIKPPRLPSSRAGIHHFAVKVTSPAYPQRYCQQRATLTINPYYDFSLGGLSPRRQSVTWSKPAARFEISMTNNGNSFARFRLEGRDDEGVCNFEFQVPGEATQLSRQAEFLLLPNETISIPIQVTPVSKSLIGLSQPTQPFIITTRMLQSEQLPRSLLGQLTRKPLVGPGIITALTIVLMALGAFLLMPVIEQSTHESLSIMADKDDVMDEPVVAPLTRPPVNEAPAAGVVDALLKDKSQMTYEAMFQEIGAQYGLDWRVLEALAYRESKMDYLAIGSASDMGLMQIVPSTWYEWAPKLNVYDPFDPYSNIMVGTAYLAYMRDLCIEKGHPEPHWMLIGYNWGPERLGRFFDNGGSWEQIPAPQRRYALSVLEMATARALSSAPSDEFYSNLAVE